MARTQATFFSSMLSDPDWTALSGSAQRTYMLILMQPRLSLAGHLDYLPSRWARFAADTTPDSIIEAVEELIEARFLLADWSTDEIAVRSFIEHDATRGRLPEPVIKGIWSAWSGIMSEQLRSEVVHGIPDEVWAKIKAEAPPGAVQMRRSPRIESETRVTDPSVPPEPLTGENGSIPTPPPTSPTSARSPFDAFWAEYPIKRDKKNARKAFDRALADGTDPSEIIDGARRYAAKVTRENTPERAVKYPQGWLNDERWTENLPPVEASGEIRTYNDLEPTGLERPGAAPGSLSMSPEEFARQEAEDERQWQEFLARQSSP